MTRSPASIQSIETPELYRLLGIMMCDRMLFSFEPEVEADLDARIAGFKSELARRGEPTSMTRSPTTRRYLARFKCAWCDQRLDRSCCGAIYEKCSARIMARRQAECLAARKPRKRAR